MFEIALVGRSNVGKSTLINALVGRRLARTSAAPGKTRLINFYRVGDGGSALYLADLPGYGYARGGVSARRDFDALTREYFSRRREPRDTARDAGGRVSPNHALLLVDARHPGLAPDRLARQWLAELSVSTTVVATKIDKLTRAERRRAYGALEAAFHASFVAVSPATGEGLKELWTLMLALPRPA